jgi:fatty acid desaturase
MPKHSPSGCFTTLCVFAVGVVVGFVAAIIAQWCGIVVWVMNNEMGGMK